MKVTEQLRELRELDDDELDGRLKQSRRELYELRFKLAVGQLENNREIHKVRRDIARILSVIHQHRLEAVPAGPSAATALAEPPVPKAAHEAATEEPASAQAAEPGEEEAE